jgi:hypothetical protein
MSVLMGALLGVFQSVHSGFARVDVFRGEPHHHPDGRGKRGAYVRGGRQSQDRPTMSTPGQGQPRVQEPLSPDGGEAVADQRNSNGEDHRKQQYP